MIKITYFNGYRSEHSEELKDHFKISNRGIDYYNPNNVSFEFKECFSEKPHNQWYKVKKEQLEITDYVVFCLGKKEFYIHDSIELLSRYTFNTHGIRANMRIGSVRKNYFFKTDNYLDLKEFINQIEKVEK